MTNNTVTLHRIYAASPRKVFKAFTDADALAFWLPPNGFTCKVHHLDMQVGGKYRMSFTNFDTGNSHSFGGEYLDIRPDEFIHYNNQFEDPNMQDIITTRIQLNPVSCGTEISIIQEGIPDAIPTEMCYLGWQESLAKLKTLVETRID